MYRRFQAEGPPALAPVTAAVGSAKSSPAAFLPTSNSAGSGKSEYVLLNSKPVPGSPFTATAYVSRETGLRVVHIDTPAPMVDLRVVVNTEIFDDSGAPHSLEHLLFSGSALFPYKGFLDTAATRSQGEINAWTSNGQTTFTGTFASAEGCLNILPVWLDHIFNPPPVSVMANAFKNEVHHIAADGSDGGVVWSEMSAVENTSASRLALARARALYRGDSAYRSETGGLMSAIRKLTVDKVREFHAHAYLPEHATILVLGATLHPEILIERLQSSGTIGGHAWSIPAILRGPIQRARAAGIKLPTPRPFLETSMSRSPPRLNSDVVKVVEYASSDSQHGQATLSWVGPPPADRIQATAVSVLSDYLCQPTIGVLSKKFVDCEDPICESIYGVQSASSPIIITFHLDSVSSDRLESVCREVKNTITQVRRQLYSKTGDDGIKERLHELIDQTRRGILVDNEDNAREALGGCTQLFLQFGELDCADLAEVYLTAVWPYNVLEKWTSKQWADALAWYDAPALMLLGKPSAKLAAELGREEKQRQQDSISQYIKEHPGSTPQDAKAAFAREIAAAREAFKPAPEELLKALPVADASSVTWQPLKVAGNAATLLTSVDQALQIHLDQELTKNDVPFPLRFDQYSSEFIEIEVALDLRNLHPGSGATSSCDATLSDTLSMYPILQRLFFQSPVTRGGGGIVDEAAVTKALLDITVDFSAGPQDGVTEIMMLSVKCFHTKYEQVVEWLADCLFKPVFTQKVVRTAVKQTEESLASARGDDGQVASTVWFGLANSQDSGIVTCSLFAISNTVKAVNAIIDGGGIAHIQKRIESLHRALCDPAVMRVSVRGDIMALGRPVRPWNVFAERGNLAMHPVVSSASSTTFDVLGRQFLTPLAIHPRRTLAVFVIPELTTTTTTLLGKGPPKGDENPDFPAFRLASAVLNDLTYGLQAIIRNSGQGYDTSVTHCRATGHVCFFLYRSPNSVEAVRAARKFIDDLVSRNKLLSDLAITSAKCYWLNVIANDLSTPAKAAWSSRMNEDFFGLPRDMPIRLVHEIQRVSKEQVLRAIEKYISPLFSPKTSFGVVTCGSGHAEEMAAGFFTDGYEVSRHSWENPL